MANTKETLNRIVQIANNEEAAVARFNDNVDITNRAIADSLSRTGKGNNAMEASLDMNGNAIINTAMRPIEKRLDGDVVVWGEVKNVLTYTNLIGQNLDKIALVGNNINKVIAVADRIDRVSYLADNLWALSDFATKEYVDATEQEIITNYMDADTALQTQITGLSEVLANEQNKLEAIEGKIPANASSSNKLSTASDLLNATQDVRADFAEADTELQMQISGQAAVLVEVKEDAMSNMAEIADLKQSKQDKLVAGANITIQGNVISATGGGGGGEVVVNSDSYRSLDAAQKVEVLTGGTYNGTAVEVGEVFTEYDGKFVKAEAGLTTEPEQITLGANGAEIFGHGGRLVVSAVNGQPYYSDDHGVSWKSGSSSSPFSASAAATTRFAHNGSIWLLLSSGVRTSTDGIAWSQTTLPMSMSWGGHLGALNGRFFVASGSEYCYSDNGIEWTIGTLPATSAYIAMCVRDSDVVLITDDKKIYTSTDGEAWNDTGYTLPIALSNTGFTMAYVCGKVVFGNSKGSVCSSDLQTWSQTSVTVYDKIFAISSDFAVKRASSEKDSYYTTTDGVTWTLKTVPSTSSGYADIATTGDGTFFLTDSSTKTAYKASYMKVGLTNLSYTKEEVDAAVDAAIAGIDLSDYVKNTSTSQYSLTLGGKATSQSYAVNVGVNSEANASGCTAIGYNAKTKANNAIQIGQGTNSTAKTMNVGLSDSLNVQLLDANGNIPAERLVNAPVPDVSLPIANCITEIPQDIKLELVNGTLTLKTGSVVHVPNGLVSGAASFTSVTLPSDRSVKFTTAPTANTQMMVFCSTTGALNANIIQPVNVCTSGTTAPSVTPYVFWNTTSNRILYNGNTQVSLPIAIITQGSDGVTKSIDKVFNGFGYIGSTVFALPGVKGLIPNGRNSDGSLNNTAFENTSVCTSQIPADGDYYLRATADYINFFSYNVYYDSDNNFIRKVDGTSQSQMFAGSCTIRNGAVASFDPKEVFRSADGNELRTVVGSYRSGNNWYRVWSDGWIEQGGSATISSYTATGTVTLHRPLSNTQYSVLVSPLGTSSSSQGYVIAYNRTTSNFEWAIKAQSSSFIPAFTWYVCGY